MQCCVFAKQFRRKFHPYMMESCFEWSINFPAVRKSINCFECKEWRRRNRFSFYPSKRSRQSLLIFIRRSTAARAKRVTAGMFWKHSRSFIRIESLGAWDLTCAASPHIFPTASVRKSLLQLLNLHRFERVYSCYRWTKFSPSYSSAMKALLIRQMLDPFAECT